MLQDAVEKNCETFLLKVGTAGIV